MLNSILAKIGLGIISVSTIVAGWLGVSPQLGSQVPITPAVFETSLASPIGISDTSMTLAKGTLIDGTTISGYMCFTVDSGQPNLEYICGTASGTSISSLIRGVNPLNGTSTVSSLTFSHRRGADVKVTDYPALSIQGRILNGIDGFANVVHYDPSVTNANITADGKNLVNYNVLVATALAGTVDASNVTKGVTKLSVASASTTNPIAIGDNDPRIPTQTQKDALVGSFGTPSATNTYLTFLNATSTASSSMVVRYTSGGQLTASATPVNSSDAISLSYYNNTSTTPKFASGLDTINSTGSTTYVIGFSPKLIRAYGIVGGNGRPSFSSGSWISSSTSIFASTTNMVVSNENTNGSLNTISTGQYLTYTNLSSNLTDPCYTTIYSTSTTGFILNKKQTSVCTQTFTWEAWGY